MRWYLPSWHGDFRLEPTKDGKATLLSVVEPTAYEQQLLAGLEAVLRQRGWWTSKEKLYEPPTKKWLRGRQKLVTVTVDAPFVELGALVAKATKSGASTLTAIRFEGGKVVTVEGTDGDLADAMKAAMGDVPKPEPTTPYREPPKKEEPKAAPAAAATVRRPTPCCPRCIPGAVEPAAEVLLEFLTPEQHESWAKDRCLVAIGGVTGVRYLLAHRHTARAQKIGRVCYSIDDDAVVHFHQTENPPEEEILAAMLILQHREAWLRNEATLFTPHPQIPLFKNPFGDGQDGVPDASLMNHFGRLLGVAEDAKKVQQPSGVSYGTIFPG